MGVEGNKFQSTIAHDKGLPFEVKYQLEVCISLGKTNEHNITSEFVSALADLASEDQAKARHVLEYAMEQEQRIYDPTSILKK